MIDVEDISFKYGHKAPILEKCSFRLAAGQILSILGPNGSGKSTLLRLLLGLNAPNSGKLKVNARLSYLAQEAKVPFDYPILEVVVMGASAKNGLFARPKAQDYDRALTMLEWVGLAKRAADGFSALSGGQKQMVFIARAMVSDPDALLMDEPTSALDYHNQDKVLRSMVEMADAGKSVIFTSHSPMQSLQVADFVLLLDTNLGPVFGKASEMLTSERLTGLYQVEILRHSTTDGDVVFPKFGSRAANKVLS